MDLKDRLNRLRPGGDGSDPPKEKKTLEGLINKSAPSGSSRSNLAPPPQELLTHYGGPGAESLESMRVAYNANPDNLGIANVLAGMLYTAQEYREAAEIYQRILSRDSSDGRAWLQLANCQVAQQDWKEAFRSYVWALQYIDDPVLKQKAQERMSAVEAAMNAEDQGGGGSGLPW